MFAIKEPCQRCGGGTTENLEWLQNFRHDVRCWGWRTALHNLWWLITNA